LRQYYPTSEEFDEMLKTKILLTHKDIESNESHAIWDGFQYKFLMTNDLYNYVGFYPKVLKNICNGLIA
jgi:hypothetical protein